LDIGSALTASFRASSALMESINTETVLTFSALSFVWVVGFAVFNVGSQRELGNESEAESKSEKRSHP
jgi:hypothetical protein